MRVALCQMRSTDDVAANLDTAERLVREAAAGGADLAALPEYVAYLGPAEGFARTAEPLGEGPIGRRFSGLAAELGTWILAGTLAEGSTEGRYDTAPLFDPSGELVASYRKIHLFDVELPGQPAFRESATFTPGHQLVTHAASFGRIGLSICYDLRFPELYRGLMALGAELLAVPAQFQHVTGRAHWHVLLRARAIENQCFVVAPAQWGTYGSPEHGRRSFGHSLVVGPWGDILAEGPEEGDGVTLADLDLAELRRVRHTLPALQHRRLGLVC
jgi:deaminated glutathione amidase